MANAMVVIGRPQLRHCHDTVVGFIRQGGCAIRRVRVKLSDTCGVAVEEEIWFNESTDVAALAEEVAEHIARCASGRSDLEAIVIVSDGG
jgi:hypothetical protein